MEILIDWKTASPFTEAEQKLLIRLGGALFHFDLNSSEIVRQGQYTETVYAFIFQNPLSVDFQARIPHMHSFLPVLPSPLPLTDEFFEKQSFGELKIKISKDFRDRVLEFYR